MAEFAPETGEGRNLTGVQFDIQKNVGFPFIQQDVPYTGDTIRTTGEELVAGVDQTPLDANQAKVRAYDVNGAITAILAIYYSWPSYVDIPLPDTLTGITVTYNLSEGNGSSSHPAAQAAGAFTGGGSVSLNPNAHAQASASIIPDITPAITQIWSRNIRAYNFAFYATGIVTLEQTLARATQYMVTAGILSTTTVTITIATPGVITWNSHGLSNGQTVLLYTTGTLPTGLLTTRVYYVVNKSTNTFQLSLTSGGAAINTTGSQTGTQSAIGAVQPLPVFKPQMHTILILGQQVSVSADASSSASINSNFDGTSYGWSYDWGNGSSTETGTTMKAKTIGPVIHGAITISSNTVTATVSASVDASTSALDLNGSTIIPAITNTPAATQGSAVAAVSPTSLSATSPAAVPTSGFYLVNENASPDVFGLLFVHAAVVDFSVFA